MAFTPPPDNPYLAARQEWTERYGSYVKAAAAWRLVGVASLCMAFVSTSYALYQSTKVQLVPYIVEVDKLGSAVVRMTQEKIFTLLMDLEIDAKDVDVNKLFKNAAEIGKASVTHKRFSMEARAAAKEEARRELLEEQRAKLEAMPNKGGVTADTKAAIREALGIV